MLQEMEMAKESAIDRIKKLDAERAKIFEEAKNEALTKAQEGVEELNSLGFHFTLTDGAARKKGKRTRSGLPPKFRHPSNPSLTWAGKGRTPLWMTELIEKGEGKDKEDFLNPERERKIA
jgi:DNA-binding protein H-NS